MLSALVCLFVCSQDYPKKLLNWFSQNSMETWHTYGRELELRLGGVTATLRMEGIVTQRLLNSNDLATSAVLAKVCALLCACHSSLKCFCSTLSHNNNSWDLRVLGDTEPDRGQVRMSFFINDHPLSSLSHCHLIDHLTSQLLRQTI